MRGEAGGREGGGGGGAELCSAGMRGAGGCARTRGCPGLAVASVVISRLAACAYLRACMQTTDDTSVRPRGPGVHRTNLSLKKQH